MLGDLHFRVKFSKNGQRMPQERELATRGAPMKGETGR